MLEMQMTGHLGKDAEVRVLDNGRVAIGFTMAHSEKYKNSEGVQMENVTWVSCTIWKKASDSVKIAEYLKKGQQVFVAGFPVARAYTGNDGEAKASLNLTVDMRRFAFLGSGTSTQANNPNPQGKAKPNPQPQSQAKPQKQAQQQHQYDTNQDIGANTNFDNPPDDLPF